MQGHAALPALPVTQPDAGPFRGSSGGDGASAAESTLRVFAVADHGICFLNAALPSSYDEQASQQSWYMEVMFKVNTTLHAGQSPWFFTSSELQ
jgi:hypothetical protein